MNEDNDLEAAELAEAIRLSLQQQTQNDSSSNSNNSTQDMDLANTPRNNTNNENNHNNDDNHHSNNINQANTPLDSSDIKQLDNVLSHIVEPSLTLQVKWKTSSYSVHLPISSTIGLVKSQISILTSVRANHQKLIIKGKNKVNDSDTLELLGLQNNDKILMIGSAEIINDALDLANNNDIVDDFDYDYQQNKNETEFLLNQPDIKENITKHTKALEISFINPLRANKKLLVLDLDYTLFDMKNKHSTENYNLLRRPYTHELLSQCYTDYDIVIWSQTSWRWLELKLTELGLLTHTQYKIAFVLDKECMFRIHSHHKDKKHSVKPLQLIWTKLPQFNSKNTIHIDDLGRNFALNPQSGLKIKPFKDADTMRNDRELVFLSQYLQLIAKLNDFTTLNHSEWKKYLQDNGKSAV